jgi:hypothetical protein
MGTCVHLWQYLAEIFLEWEIFQTKVVEKIRTHILCSITFSLKSCRLWDNVEKYGTARQATDDNIIRRMRFACCITKATDTHSEYVILIACPRQQWLRERATMLRYTVLNIHRYCVKCAVILCKTYTDTVSSVQWYCVKHTQILCQVCTDTV